MPAISKADAEAKAKAEAEAKAKAEAELKAKYVAEAKAKYEAEDDDSVFARLVDVLEDIVDGAGLSGAISTLGLCSVSGSAIVASVAALRRSCSSS